MKEIRTSALRAAPIESFPKKLLLGFMQPSPNIERAVRVGEYLRTLQEPFVLIIDDGRMAPVGWRYAATKVIEEGNEP